MAYLIKKISIPFFLILIFFPFYGNSSDTIYISSTKDSYFLRGLYFDILEDPDSDLTIGDVTGKFSSQFKVNDGDVPRNENLSSAYWIRFTLSGPKLHTQDIFFELFDFRIDHYQLFIPTGSNSYIVKQGGDLEPFENKPVPHKNFIRKIPNPESTPQTYFVRIKSDQPVGIIGELRTLPRLLRYSNSEYFFLAIFYGIVVSMALYNFLLYLSIKEKTYLYYVLYVLSIGIYALSQDGLGFQFLWPNQPVLNNVVYPLALYSMIFWVLLYARSFLGTKNNLPFFDKGIFVFLVIRTLILILGFAFYKPLLHLPLIDLIPMLFIFIAGIVKFRKGYIAARYYIFAFNFLFIGFGISALALVKIVPDSIFSVYSFNFGVVGQMIFLSLALADRIKMLMRENEEVHKLIILQLKEKKELKDKLNRDLEEKVGERTKELEEKNSQLDTFVYKASHDIKGPLRSIIGLTTVGMKDVNDPVANQYLEHILKSTKRLDATLTDLLNLARVKSAKIEKVAVDFVKLLDDILLSFQHHPEYKDIKYQLNINQKSEFYSDPKLLVSIIQNLVENGIKYRDKEKGESFLKISINTDEHGVSMLFEDNGLGLTPESQERIFEMFYRVSEDNTGTGLGLHLVKMAVNKLKGSIKVKSKEGVGSEFLIQLPS